MLGNHVTKLKYKLVVFSINIKETLAVEFKRDSEESHLVYSKLLTHGV
jgi:hypothetical protein